jgi:hypothetical protein
MLLHSIYPYRSVSHPAQLNFATIVLIVGDLFSIKSSAFKRKSASQDVRSAEIVSDFKPHICIHVFLSKLCR